MARRPSAAATASNVPNPFFGQIASGPLSGAQVQRQRLLVPFPDYQTVTTFGANNASSSFHSFQFLLERRFSEGLSAMISYTASKLITDNLALGGGGDASGTGDFRIGAYNRQLEKAVDIDDVSQRLVASGVVEVPVGRGRKFGANMPKALDLVAGGWQFNTVTTLQAGRPLQVRGSNNFTGINYPDLVADPSLPSSERGPNRWFNTDAFRNPANFVIGNAPRTLPSTRGPGLVDVSFSVFKVYLRRTLPARNALGDVQRLQYRKLWHAEHQLHAERAGRQYECQLQPHLQRPGSAPDANGHAPDILRKTVCRERQS